MLNQSEAAHVVLVEDEESLMTVNLWWVKEIGWKNIHGVYSVAELMEYLASSLRQGRPVDLILMDIVMPEMNGIEGTQLVRAQEAFSDTPIIMLTSMTDQDILESAFQAGANDYVIKPFNEIELRARMRSALRLKQETDRRKEREKDLLKLSQALIARQIHAEESLFQDTLTGIYNRRAFDKKLQDEWISCYIAQKPLALIMLDVDHFKQCNDQFGHLAGDECLKLIARALPGPETGFFSARYGGEEFVVIVPGESLQGVEQQAEAIRYQIESSQPDDQRIKLTASLGVASLMPGDYPDSSSLIAAADEALYRAKSAGRNCVSR